VGFCVFDQKSIKKCIQTGPKLDVIAHTTINLGGKEPIVWDLAIMRDVDTVICFSIQSKALFVFMGSNPAMVLIPIWIG
jgi:hypothetical protein